MKDTILATIIGLAVIFWFFAVDFGLWGGNPEGAFAKIKKLQAQVNTQAEQIEVLRTQVNQEGLCKLFLIM